MDKSAGNRIRTHIKTLLDTPLGRYVIPVAFIVFLIGTPVALYMLEKLASPVASWYDNAWEFRKPVTVTYSGSPLTNHDVLIQMDTASLISENKIQADCDDIRLVDSDDVTSLDYWVESGCNTSNTQIWTRVPSIPDGGKEIYLYYGNGSALNAEETWGGSFTLLSTGSCAAGWSRNADFDGRFLYGSSSYGTTGGSSSHDHGQASCTTNTVSLGGCRTGGGRPGSPTHSHASARVDVNSATVLPPYLDMVMCESSNLAIPTGAIAIFDTAVPSGWTRYTSLDSKFARGAATAGGTGGATTHTHTTTGGYATGASGSTNVCQNGSESDYSTNHTHTTGSGSTGSADNTPPYLNVVYGQLGSSTTGVAGMISVVDVLPPLGWTRFTSLDAKLPMGAASAGGTGGSATHTHSVNIATGGPSATSIGAGSGSSPGSRYNHTHSCTATTSSASNLPPYLETIFAKRSNPSASTALGSEISNAPQEPTISAAQGLSTTSIRWNFIDNSSNEIGFKVYDTNGNLKVTCESTDITYCDESGLSPNTTYTRKVTAYNSQGESQFSETVTRYTLAATPVVVIDSVTESTVELSASGGTNIDAGSSGLYFDCTGSSCDTGLNSWIQTTTATATGISTNTLHSFHVKARNGDGVETAYSSTESAYTLTNVPTIALNTLGSTSITLQANGLHNVASGSSGALFDCVDSACDEGINEWVQTATDTVTGLQPNTQYEFRVKARNGDSTETDYSSSLTLYTAANTPGEPSTLQLSTSSINVVIDQNSNDSTVEYAIQDASTGDYINMATGALQDSESWGTYAQWGGLDGVNAVGLDSGTEYVIQVKARNGDNAETEFGASASVYTALNAPTITAPEVLSSTSINWTFTDNESNETGFKVYDGSGNLMVTCASQDLSGCEETGLTPNTSYTRKVVAYNGGGDSPFSGTRTTITHAAVPSVDSASVTNSTAQLELGISTNPSGTEIAIQDEASGLFVDVNSGELTGTPSWATLSEIETSINAEVIGLDPNTQYEFRAKARNDNSVETGYSGSVSIYTLANELDAPEVSSSNSSTATVVIDRTGNPSSTEYAIYRVEEDGYLNKTSGVVQDEESWGTYDEFGAGDGIGASGLGPNEPYSFKVKARNGDGVETGLSDAQSVYTWASVPQNVDVTTSSSTVVNVTFDVNSNPEITEYAIQEVNSGNFVNKGTGVLQSSADWGTYAQFGEDLGIGVVGLTPNAGYEFRVKARNADDVETAYSTSDSANTLANAPTAPTVEQVSTTVLNVILATAGNPVSTEYTVQEINSGEYLNSSSGLLQSDPSWGTYAQYGGVSGLNVTGLSSGESYDFRVKARNADNVETAYSSSSSQATLLSSPEIAAPTVLSSTSIRWNFTDTESNEDGFRVYDNENVQVAQCTGEDLTYCDEFGLTPNSSYTRKVVAYNENSSSNPSSNRSVVTLANTPNAPIVAADSATVLNLKIAENNNPAPTQFSIQETVSGNYVDTDGNLGTTQRWATKSQLGGDRGVNVKNLFANAQYNFVVKARNLNSIQTSNSSQTSKYTLAVTPSGPSITPTASSQVNLVLNTGGNPPFTQYYIQEVDSGKYLNRSAGALRDGKDWSTYSQYGSSSGISISGLSVNSRYRFRVVGRNGDGVESPASDVISVYTLANIPSRPSVQIVGPETVRISLDANGNPATTQLEVAELSTGSFGNPTGGQLSTSQVWRAVSEGTSITLTGLVPGKQYSFAAKARNGDNVETSLSTEALAITTASPVNLAEVVPVSTTAIRLRIDPLRNDSSVQYSIVESGTGLFVNKTTGLLQTVEDWGTYSEFGGNSGIIISNLNSATDYSFRVNSRNAAQVVTGLGARRIVGTNAVLQNIPNELRVFLKEDSSKNPADLGSELRGLHSLRVARGEYLVADIPVQFDTNRDWRGVVIDSDPDTSRVAVKVTEDHGFEGKYVMYVVKGNTNAFVLCPHAENIGDVSSDCTDSVLFVGPFPQTKTVGSNTVSVSIAIIDGVEYWVIDGLTGTGGQGVIYSPGEEPKAPSSEEEEEPGSGGEGENDGEEEPDEEETPVSSNPVVNVVTKTIQSAPKAATAAVEGVKETLDSTVGKLPKEELTVVTTTTSVATVTVGVATISGGISQIPYYLTQLVFGILSFLGFRKTGKPYGYVYDSVTKKPINRAIVRIYDQKERLVWTDVTDAFGAFNADLATGKYKILVRKSGYRFPSEVITGQSDYPLEPVYHGEIVSFSKKSVVRHVIPLDPTGRGWFSGMGALLKNRLSYILKQLHILIFLAGVILAVYTYNKYPTTDNLLILVVYIPTVVLLLRSLLKKPHSYGVVKDRAGKVMEGIIVGLKEMEFDRYVGKRITDAHGLYQFLVPSGVYQLEILNDDFVAVKFQGGSRIVDVEKKDDAVIARDIIVKKK